MMKTSSDQQDKLEHLVDRALREQPLRRAPRSLESRVLAEIGRRTARPWWHKQFACWPVAARVVFLAAALGCVKLGVEAVTWLTAPLESGTLAVDLPAEVTWIQALTEALIAIVRHLPPVWVYGGVAVLAAMYAVVFGVGAAAYRTLHPGPRSFAR